MRMLKMQDEVPEFIQGYKHVNPHRAKLTPEKALAVYHSSLPYKTLASLYGVTEDTVRRIKKRTTYSRYLPERIQDEDNNR